MNVKVGGATMKYWKQFAEMLGLELNQEFVLTDVDGKRKNRFTYKIIEDGILYRPPEYINWLSSSLVTLIEIINGDYKVVTKPWKPEKGEKYWFYLYGTKEVIYSRWGDGTYDLILWNAGNCFRTKEEAETKGKEIMDQIQKEYEE